MKKSSKYVIIFAVVLAIGLLVYKQFDKVQPRIKPESTQAIYDLAKTVSLSNEKKMPNDEADLAVWIEETTDLIEDQYKMEVTEVSNIGQSVKFELELPEDATGIDYVLTSIEYLKPNLDYDLDTETKQVKFINYLSFSDTYLVKKPGTHEQLKTSRKIVAILNNDSSWHPYYVVDKYDYYQFEFTEEYDKNKPAFISGSDNKIVDSIVIEGYDEPRAAELERALELFKENKVSINNEIIEISK